MKHETRNTKHKNIMKQKTVTIIFASIIILLGMKVSSAHAATYYVSSSGNDSNGGTSEATPWKTIHKVIYSSFKPGDSILFKKGDIWLEQLEIPASGSAENPIIFGAYGAGNNPIIDGEGVRTYCVYMLNRSNITIQDFTVQNTTTPGIGVGIYANGSNTISNITVQRVASNLNGWDGFGIEANNPKTSAAADNINIVDCTADQNGRAGFHVYSIDGGSKGINFIRDKATYAGQKQPHHGFSSYKANNVHRYYCEAAYTGLVPGCLNINSKNAGSCKLPNADSEGIGFAFDDATKDSSNVACFSHDNAGTGF
jgi:hypothetical protein